MFDPSDAPNDAGGDAPGPVRRDQSLRRALDAGLPGEPGLPESSLLAQMQLLNQLAYAVGSLDLSRILRVALWELKRNLPRIVCAVWLVEQDRKGGESGRDSSVPNTAPAALTLTDATADETRARLGLVPSIRRELAQTCFAGSVAAGEAVFTDLLQPDDADNPMVHQLAAGGATLSFAVPLRAGEEIMGVLQGVCLNAGGFTREQIQLLYLVADLLGPAASNCQLFHRLQSAYEDLRLTQSRLIEAEKMRALGELASGMAHDFNNSLCGALGFLDLTLADPTLPAKCREYLQSSRTCTLDAAQTVRRVQEFARWRHQAGAAESLDLNDLVRQTVALTRPRWESLAQTQQAAIRVEVQTTATRRLRGCPAELREVLTNLVFNALDAMPQGGTLSLRTWSTPTDLYLAVSDTGVGIRDEVRRRLFEPFFTTKGAQGTGLGLSVSFGIVKRYQGDITVASEVGRGSTFTVRFPAEAGATAPRSAEAAAPPVPVSRSLRVLVVEDEESIRRFLAMGLTQMGHHVRLAADGTAGLEALAQERFDVVLTDLGLPGVSGEEVARAVAEQSPGTPVLVITGWGDQLKAKGQTLPGVARVLSKPIQLQTLADALGQVCPDPAPPVASDSFGQVA